MDKRGALFPQRFTMGMSSRGRLPEPVKFEMLNTDKHARLTVDAETPAQRAMRDCSIRGLRDSTMSQALDASMARGECDGRVDASAKAASQPLR